LASIGVGKTSKYPTYKPSLIRQDRYNDVPLAPWPRSIMAGAFYCGIEKGRQVDGPAVTTYVTGLNIADYDDPNDI
jgi:hypothetical protein